MTTTSATGGGRYKGGGRGKGGGRYKGSGRGKTIEAALGVSIGLLLAVCSGCGAIGAGARPPDTVLVSVINVTPFDVDALLSGVLGEEVDSVDRTVAPSDSADVSFVCLDELVVGNPLEPTAPGITIDSMGNPTEIAPFSIAAGESFGCGDVIEIIVSGTTPETFNVDVFALTPP